MNDRDFWLGATAFVIGVLLVLGGASYGSYRYGRYAERRALYEALVRALQDTYYDGYSDGEKYGRAHVKCENEDEDNGRH